MLKKCCNGAENTIKFIWWNIETHWWNGDIVKWRNKKHLHIIMVKWRNKYGEIVQRIHMISHSEIVKHNSIDILFTKLQNCKMVKWLYSPSSTTVFRTPLQQWGQIPFLESIGCFLRNLCIICLWAVLRWSSKSPKSLSKPLRCHIPTLILIDTFLLCHPYYTDYTGGGDHTF